MNKVKEKGMKRETIEIKEEVRLPGTDIVLEKGDKVRIYPKMLKKEGRTPVKEGLPRVVMVSYYSWAASAIVNDDYSGLDRSEEREVDAFLDWVKSSFGRQAIVAATYGDSRFGRPDFGDLKGEIIDYVVHT